VIPSPYHRPGICANERKACWFYSCHSTSLHSFFSVKTKELVPAKSSTTSRTPKSSREDFYSCRSDRTVVPSVQFILFGLDERVGSREKFLRLLFGASERPVHSFGSRRKIWFPREVFTLVVRVPARSFYSCPSELRSVQFILLGRDQALCESIRCHLSLVLLLLALKSKVLLKKN
jgi:hypothetical protein